MFELVILAVCGLAFTVSALGYIERRQWWTFRLWLSRFSNGRLFLLLTLATALKSLADIARVYDRRLLRTKVGMGTVVVGFWILTFRYLLPLAENAGYVRLRWKAWTGRSRTGIAPSLTRYCGDRGDWESLASSCPRLEPYPVDAFLTIAKGFTGRAIVYDPTEILKARLRLDEESDTIWLPRSQAKVGVYAPVESGQAASLLWGGELGFMRRCSRGIIAVPTYLLTPYPKIKEGIDGRALCLAHGIMARNKGLDPSRLVCNLQSPQRLRTFEENGSLWPRPGKTLRSFYHKEMAKAFSGLGASFICAATELALLLADAKEVVVMDWLDAGLEHQDLSLNNQAAALGASGEDLLRLYRGQYVAMLVSLSEHKAGIRIRPELTVFKAMCGVEGVRESPAWLRDMSMAEREAQEATMLGARGMALVQAAV